MLPTLLPLPACSFQMMAAAFVSCTPGRSEQSGIIPLQNRTLTAPHLLLMLQTLCVTLQAVPLRQARHSARALGTSCYLMTTPEYKRKLF